MSWRPRTIIAACIECNGEPEPKFRGIFSDKVRMECRCGVSGAWRKYRGSGDPWHDAVDGWHGSRERIISPPPPPRR